MSTASNYEQYVGNYRLLRNIWTGHGCQVWEAMHKTNNTRWALKVLNPNSAGDKEQVGYLRNEYQVAAALRHPRVIQVEEFETAADLPYMVMELYPAPNMKQRIRQGRDFVWPLASRIVRQATEALLYFHQAGWVHRDIKPDNFLIADSGDIKLIDFALAQKPQGTLARLLGGKQKKIQGTPSYISPEAIRKKPLDQRADIYSLGCVYYELIALKPPFSGASTNDLLMKHIRSPAPTLTAVDANIRDSFAKLVQRMMSKEPNQRPQSLQDVLDVAKQGVFVVEPAKNPK
ncbi:MAG: serine/threonine-protein kinase [Pirellulales bacterium]